VVKKEVEVDACGDEEDCAVVDDGPVKVAVDGTQCEVAGMCDGGGDVKGDGDVAVADGCCGDDDAAVLVSDAATAVADNVAVDDDPNDFGYSEKDAEVGDQCSSTAVDDDAATSGADVATGCDANADMVTTRQKSRKL